MATSSQISSGIMPLHHSPQDRPETAPPVEALYVPRPSDAYTPPLSTALRLAREDLAVQQGANIHSHEAMIRAAVTLEIRLRLLLDALDADGIGRPAADASEAAA